MIAFFAVFVSLCAVGLGEDPPTGEISKPSDKCGRHEQFGCRCGDFSCYNPYNQVYCYACKQGCFCKEGYVRNDNNKCILIENCPRYKKCPGINESFQRCHPVCDPSCNDLNPTCTGCFFGCFCRPGFVRDDNNECIDRINCPNQQCGENEEWRRECGEKKCGDPNTDEQCIPGRYGCFCKTGFVRTDGICISDQECLNRLNRCGTNEDWDYCKCGDKTCNDPYSNAQCISCRPGCFCKDGFVRDEYNICVPLEWCYNLPN